MAPTHLSPRILVIEDAADTCLLIVTFLRNRGFAVDSAVDGTSGVEAALARRPELVITDLLMPDLSGFRVLAQVRSDPDYQPRVIIISAHDAPMQRAYAGAMGADDYLPKPFVLKQLFDSVQRLFPATTQPSAGVEDSQCDLLIRQ